jgi:hypothetical protein
VVSPVKDLGSGVAGDQAAGEVGEGLVGGVGVVAQPGERVVSSRVVYDPATA